MAPDQNLARRSRLQSWITWLCFVSGLTISLFTLSIWSAPTGRDRLIAGGLVLITAAVLFYTPIFLRPALDVSASAVASTTRKVVAVHYGGFATMIAATALLIAVHAGYRRAVLVSVVLATGIAGFGAAGLVAGRLGALAADVTHDELDRLDRRLRKIRRLLPSAAGLLLISGAGMQWFAVYVQSSGSPRCQATYTEKAMKPMKSASTKSPAATITLSLYSPHTRCVVKFP